MHTGKVELKRGKMVMARALRPPPCDCHKTTGSFGRRSNQCSAGLFPHFRTRLLTGYSASSLTPCGASAPTYHSTEFMLNSVVFHLDFHINAFVLFSSFLKLKSMIRNILKQMFYLFVYIYQSCLG